MLDLGDFVVLAFSPKDTSGAAADVGAAVVTVTLPDGSTATPAVVHGGVGVYTATYTTSQAGRHSVRWVGTGANAQAYTDAFNVVPSAPSLIVGLAEARASIGLPVAAVAKDEVLRNKILSATPIIEDLVGPVIPRPLTESYDGGGSKIKLLYSPVLSVSSIVESFGNYTRTLTAQPLDGSTFDAYGYTLDARDGLLTRRVSGSVGAFAAGRRNVLVTYVAGRAVVGQNILDATCRLVRHFFQQEQQGSRPDMGSPDSTTMTTTPSGFAVPRAVVELCADDVRVVGMA